MRFAPRKVATPGSQAPASSQPARGRPKKKRTVEHKKARGKYRERYTEEELEEAVRLVKGKMLSINAASRKFDIPKATLFDKLHLR